MTPPTAAQQNVLGDVAVTSDICLDGFGANANDPTGTDYSTECSTKVNPALNLPPGSGQEGQVLVGYLVPDGTGAPAQLTASDLNGTTFVQSSGYASWLTANVASGSGLHWVAYMSSDLTLTKAVEFHLTADFTPPAGTSTFSVRQIELGDRANVNFGGATQDDAGDSLDPGRALDCAETVTENAPPSDMPTPEQVTGCANDQSTSAGDANLNVTLNTIALSGPASPVTAQAGTTAIVPFTISSGGHFDATAPFSASATTNATGATATPESDSFVPLGTPRTPQLPSGSQTENVSVPLPASLAPGTYTVELTVAAPTICSNAAQCTRTATATLDVTAAASVAPAIKTGDVLKFNARTLTLSLQLATAESKRLILERRHGRRWVRIRTIREHVDAGRHTLSLHRLFGRRLHRHDHDRLLVATVGASTASGSRTFTFTVH